MYNLDMTFWYWQHKFEVPNRQVLKIICQFAK